MDQRRTDRAKNNGKSASLQVTAQEGEASTMSFLNPSGRQHNDVQTKMYVSNAQEKKTVQAHMNINNIDTCVHHNTHMFVTNTQRHARVSGQNGVSLLYTMLEIHHSGREPSMRKSMMQTAVCVYGVQRSVYVNTHDLFTMSMIDTDVCTSTKHRKLCISVVLKDVYMNNTEMCMSLIHKHVYVG